MPRFEGCVEAKEISLTRKGANQHAHVLIRKHAATAADPKLENDPMPTVLTEAEKAAATQAAAIAKIALAQTNKIAAMSDVTKAHYLGLGEDAQLAFLEKSAEEQAKEAEAAKAEATRVAAEAEAAKTGATAREVELQKTVGDLRSEIDTLKAQRAEDEITKRADTEFADFPGGSERVIPLLKAYAKLPEAERTASEELLKAQCKLAKDATTTFGNRSAEVVSKAAVAKDKIDKAASALSVEKKIPLSEAWEQVIEKAEFAEDVAAMEAGV